jgi:UDP-GlcNAc:undecaprenyl-phosphate GlcNAc-1-phosphate transferase
MIELLTVLLTSFGVCLALTPVARALALRCGLVDRPDGRRKLHQQPIPLAGGVAIAASAGLVLALVFARLGRAPTPLGAERLLGMVLAALVVVALGVADDLIELRGRHKLVGQMLAVAVLLGFGVQVQSIQLFGRVVELGLLSVPFTAFVLLGAVNSMNLMDGMDGLLGVVTVIVSLGLAALALLGNHWPAACAAVALAGAVLGFLWFNLPPASTFLGDAGSMLIGLVIGVLAIECSLTAPSRMAVAAPAVLLTLPIFDTTAAILRRKLTGRSVYTTDRGHLHHCLLRSKLTHWQALALVAALCLVAAVGSVAGRAWANEYVMVGTGLFVVASLVLTRLFGHTELELALKRSLSFGASMLSGPRPGRPRQVEVRLQGSFDWKEFWSRLTGCAAELRLRSVRLDVNVPAIDEGYHASWVRAVGDEEDGLWRIEVPLTSREQVVGRLELAGRREDQECVSVKVAALGRFITELEGVVGELARAREARQARGGPTTPLPPTHQPPPAEQDEGDSRVRVLAPLGGLREGERRGLSPPSFRRDKPRRSPFSPGYRPRRRREHQMADNFIDGGEAQGAAAGPSRNLLQVLWQRKALVLFGLTVGTLVGTLVYLQRPPVYQSSAQVHVVKKRNEFIQSPDGFGMSFYEDYIATHLVLIRSPTVVQKAAEDPRVRELPSFAGQANPSGAIQAGLSASRDTSDSSSVGSSPIINLSYRGPVAADCPVVLNAIIKSYEGYLEKNYKNVSKQTERLITDARNLLHGKLEGLKAKQAEAREAGPLVWGGKEGGNIHLTRLAALEARRSAAQLRRVEINDRLGQIAKARARGGVPERLLLALDGSRARAGDAGRTLEDQLLPLLQQEQTLLEDYGEDHPKLKAVRRQIALTRDLYLHRGAPAEGASPALERPAAPAQVQVCVQSFKDELEELAVTEKALDEMIAKEERLARVVISFQNKDDAYTSDILNNQQLYQQTVKRLDEINIVRDLGGYEASVLSPPEVGGKVAPNLSQTLSAWVVLGLLGGVALAYLADVSDKSFRTPEEIRRRLGLPIVGHIPFTTRAEATAATGQAAAGPLDASLLTHHRPRAIEAEAYRSLRTALYFSTRGERHKVIQVTSPNMGDGKTTLAANLAVCIAQSGKTVVLIDADCRRPRLHRLFGLSSEMGLTSVIVGECGPQEAVRPTAVPHLSVLPCGPRPANPAELLTSPKFEELLNELRGTYDFVLVDSPPLLAVTDPCVVAARADGVLLTIRVSKNGRPAAERAKEMLAALGANVLGVVVNGTGKEAGAYGYSYRHYRYDHYGYEYKSRDEERPADDVVKAEKNGTPAEGAAPPR